MSDIKIMPDKDFSTILENLPKDDRKIDAGNFSDNDVSVIFTIHPIEKQQLNLKIRFKKHPEMYPFWITIDVKINDKVDHFFFARSDNSKKYSQQNFHTKFTKDCLTNGTTVSYHLHHLPAYISTLYNRGCLCYLNSVIQILFHLSSFRKEIMRYNSHQKGYFSEMKALFKNMSECNDCYSAEPLLLKFGWPESVAFNTQQDASEFLYFFLNDIITNVIQRKQLQKNLDNLFVSHFKLKTEDGNQEKEDSQVMIQLDLLHKKESNINMKVVDMIKVFLQEKNGMKKFSRFPEVLFIQVDGELGSFEDKLDLSQFQLNADEEMKHSQYTLSGLIIREARRNNRNSGHFKCLVRSPCKDVWHYFSDAVQGFYNTAEKGKSIQQICKDSDVQNRIKNEKNQSVFENRVRVLMYVADDVHNAFDFDEKVIPSKKSIDNSNKDDIKSCMFHVIESKKLVDHVNDGKPDFKDIEETCSFEMAKGKTKSDLYNEVANRLQLEKNSFTLRIAEKNCGGAPSGYIIENSDSLLEFDNTKCTIYCFSDDKTEKDSLKIPIVFLSFEFKPRMFLHHLANNLYYSSLVSPNIKSNQDKSLSQEARRAKVQDIEAVIEKMATNSKDEIEFDTNKNEKGSEIEAEEYSKYNFKYVDTLFVPPNSTLSEVKSDLLKKLKKPENSNIKFYMNVNEISNIELVSFKEIEINSLIKSFNSKNTGRIIYVQCMDEIISNKRQVLDRVIDVKFLFFNYKNQALDEKSCPRTLPLSFLMEKFSIPVNFCKLDDPINKRKTILFPIKNEFDLDGLNKVICKAMDEPYDPKNFMQLFFSFRKDTVPFAKPIPDVTTLNKALSYNLKKRFKIKTDNLYIKNSDILPDNFRDDSDIDYDTNPYIISIHYKILGPDKKGISFRVDFSDDSYKVNFSTQIVMNTGQRISTLIFEFLQIYNQFDSFLSNEDKKIFELIKNINNEDKEEEEKKKLAMFTEHYQILKISNCKISGMIKPSYFPSSNVSVRFQRIPKYFDEPNCIGIIPVYFGARYNDKNLVVAFGSPFFFPVYKDEMNIDTDQDFESRNCYERLVKLIEINKIKHEHYDLMVTNYDGTIDTNIPVFSFMDLMVRKEDIYNDEVKSKFNLQLAVVFKDYHQFPINAAIYFDETQYFSNNPFKILQQ